MYIRNSLRILFNLLQLWMLLQNMHTYNGRERMILLSYLIKLQKCLRDNTIF